MVGFIFTNSPEGIGYAKRGQKRARGTCIVLLSVVPTIAYDLLAGNVGGYDLLAGKRTPIAFIDPVMGLNGRYV